MDYSFALHLFALMLLLLCIALVPFVLRRDPIPADSIVRIEALPPTLWPGALTRTGVAYLFGSFVLLLMACKVLIN